MPLAHQIQGRRDDQGAALAVNHGQVGDEGFARTGGKHDHAAEPCSLPGAESADLVGARLAMHERMRGKNVIAPCLVVVRDLHAAQGPHHVCIATGWRAQAVAAFIPSAAGQPSGLRGQAGNFDSAGDEAQGNPWGLRWVGLGVHGRKFRTTRGQCLCVLAGILAGERANLACDAT